MPPLNCARHTYGFAFIKTSNNLVLLCNRDYLCKLTSRFAAILKKWAKSQQRKHTGSWQTALKLWELLLERQSCRPSYWYKQTGWAIPAMD